MNILAIDDVNDNLLTIKAMLGAFMPSARLKVADSATEGIALAKSYQPDVILLDIQMPEMDGFEATRRLKRDAKTHHIPIILITAHRGDSEYKVKGLDCGADAFLSKPLEETELVAQIHAMFRIKKSEDALRQERDNLESLVVKRIEEVYEKQRLNQLLLDAIPHFTYLINRGRKVIALNRMAAHQGTAVGDYCWHGIYNLTTITEEQNRHFCATGEPLPGTQCTFCRADAALATRQTEYREVDLCGVIWDIWWIPVDESSFLHYAVNITERKKAEEEKRILERQLLHSQKLESIGTLAGGVAHDFNNILTVISGYCTLLQRSLTDDDTLSMVNEIIKSSDRAAEMTRSLLMFSSKQTLELRPDSLKQILQGLSKTLKRLIREDIILLTDLTDDELPVIADRVQIEQVVMNLVVNARDAIHAEGCITVRSERLDIRDAGLLTYGVEVPGEYAVLTVSDTGSGMDNHTLEHLFEPFFTTKESGKGTGLGLSITYAIIRKHNGAIVVKSHPGQGTTFRISLPVHGETAPQQQAAFTSEQHTGSETILVVEDDVDVRTMLLLTLESYGYRVISAENGESGEAAFKDNRSAIKLVISDIIMPRKNGVEMCRDIRQLDASVPIILTSGYSDGLLDNGGALEGNTVFIRKPLNPGNVLRLIRETLNESNAEGA